MKKIEDGIKTSLICPKCRKGKLIKGNLEDELRQWKCDECGELLYWHIKKHIWLDRDYQPLKGIEEKVHWGFYAIRILSGIGVILLFAGGILEWFIQTHWLTIILIISLGCIFSVVAIIFIAVYLSERQLKKEKDVNKK